MYYSCCQQNINKIAGMRKCRNWQTSKTKDLVTIAVVWVQVPSSALFFKKKPLNFQGFFFCSIKHRNKHFIIHSNYHKKLFSY